RHLALGRPPAHQDCDVFHGLTLYPDSLDFPFQVDPGVRPDAFAHRLAERLDVGGGCAAEIDEEVAVQLGDLRVAGLEPAAAGLVDHLPGIVAGRVLEGRAAGAVARLRGLALVLDRGHLDGDRVRVAGFALKDGGGEDHVLRHRTVPVREPHVRVRIGAQVAHAVDAARRDENVPGLAAIGAAVHAQRAADGAGDAG